MEEKQPHIPIWRIFEAIVTLENGSQVQYISATIGDETKAKQLAMDAEWSSPAIDATVFFRADKK